MTDVNKLITDHIDVWTSAIKNRNSQGRGTSKKIELTGVNKLRELILELAVSGKLVPQDVNDEPAGVLLERIAEEKAQLIIDKKIKKQKPLPTLSEAEKAIELPNGWEITRFGNCNVLKSGNTFKEKPLDENGSYLYCKVGDMNLPKNTFEINESNHHITPSERELALLIPAGSIIFPKRGGAIATNKKRFVYKDIFADPNVMSATPYKAVSLTFLMVWLDSFDLASLNTGTSVPQINNKDIEPLIFLLPPLAEQHRIVAKVDELMALCDQLEQQTEQSLTSHQTLVEVLLAALTNCDSTEDFQTSWQRIAEHFDVLFTTEDSIEKLKQTILQLSVMGKLVPQNPTDEPASVLLEKIAEEKAQLIADKKIKKQKPLPVITDEEKPFELPKGWEWSRVWDVAKIITSGSRDWAKYYSEEGAIFVTMGNLSRSDYRLRLDTLRHVNPPIGGEGSRTKLEENDLLLSITGDVGNLGLIPNDFGEAYINQHTCLLRFMADCQNRYFPELMRSPLAKHQFDAPQRGIKNSFRLGDVGEMIVPIPPLAEQHRIVAKVDELMALCEQLKVRLSDAQTTQLHLADAVVTNALN